MEKIITFGCQKTIHVYPEKCGVSPRWPFKSHENLEEAKKHLIEKGIIEPQVKIEK